MWQSILDAFPNVMLAASLGGLVTFAVTYSRNSHWRKTRPGRALMYMILSMISVIGIAFVNLIFGSYAGEDIIRAVTYGALTASVFNIVRVLYQELRLEPFWLLGVKRKKRK